jgi:SSS family solute:Na+ symporter
LLFAIIPVVIGITAFNLLPGIPNSDQAFPELVTKILPAGIGVIVLIAGLSAVISSASSDAIAGTSILLRDVFILLTGRMPPKEKALKYSRIGATVTSLFAVLFSMLSNNIFDYIKDMVGMVMSGMFVCVFFGRFWKRSTWQGGVAALITGSLTAFIFILVPTWKAAFGGVTIPSVVVSTICCIVVSLLTPPNTVTDEEALASLEKEREVFSG